MFNGDSSWGWNSLTDLASFLKTLHSHPIETGLKYGGDAARRDRPYDSQPEEARRAVVHNVSEQLVPYETGQGIRVPFSTHLVMGIR